MIGSTLALEYMRAGMSQPRTSPLKLMVSYSSEYVAPLGSTSLIFNFLFAKFLVDTPVTNYDIYVSRAAQEAAPFADRPRVQSSSYWA